MGTNTLETAYLNGQIIDASHINELTQAVLEDFVPRDSAGVATNEGGDLGTTDYHWDTIWGKTLTVDQVTLLKLLGNFIQTITNDATTTGADATLSHPGTSIVRLTNASLVSITDIDGKVNGKSLIIINDTTVQIVLKNNTNILTGTGEDLDIPSTGVVSLVYASGTGHWRVVGGAGGAGGASKTQGTRGAPVVINGSGFTFTGSQGKLIVFAEGDTTGTRDLSAVTTPISAGTKIGQEILFIWVSATKLVQFANFGDLLLLGDYLSDLNNKLHVLWDGSKWLEIGR